MSEEIKDNNANIPFDENNQQEEQSEGIAHETSLNDDDEENDLSLSTPDDHETPMATSFSDINSQKQDEQTPISEENSTSNGLEQLLRTISDKSNKEAGTTILNTVKEKRNVLCFNFLSNIDYFSLSMETLI